MFILKHYKDKDVRMRTYDRVKRAQKKKSAKALILQIMSHEDFDNYE